MQTKCKLNSLVVQTNFLTFATEPRQTLLPLTGGKYSNNRLAHKKKRDNPKNIQP